MASSREWGRKLGRKLLGRPKRVKWPRVWKEQAMVEQLTSGAATGLEDNQQAQSVVNPTFQARMSLVEARATLLAALKSLTAGSFTGRVGMIARDVCGARFGRYQPPEIVNWLRSDDFQQKFEEELENWKKSWDPDSPPKRARIRQIQYRACLRSITEKWWKKIADAIESMIASH